MKVKRKFWLISLSVIITAVMVLTACQPAATETAAAPTQEQVQPTEAPTQEQVQPTEVPTEAATTAPAEPVTLTYIDTSGFYTLDIFLTPWFTYTQGAMYDTLVNVNLKGDGYDGILADSWEIAPDGMSITFKLKDGVTFHDGTPWNADAALWNLNKYLDPNWPKEINQNWTEVIDNWEKVDDMTIKVNFKSPYATLFADLVVTYFVSPTAYEAEGQDNFGSNPVGTGAWIPVEIVPNNHVLYKRNPDYTWGAPYTNGKPPAADFFEIKFIPDQAAAYASLETGEASFIPLPAQFITNAESNPDITVNKGTSGELWYLGINWKKEIYQNFDFRQAIAHALDREEIVLAAFEGDAFLTGQFVPAGTPGYNAETDAYALEKWNYDPDLSNQILDNLGWTDTDGDGIREKDGQPLEFPVIYNTEEAVGRAAEVIQGEFQDIGIALDLNPMEAAAQADILVAEQQDFFIRPYGYPDPVILSWMVQYPNRNAYEDAGATELQTKADATMDPAARMKAVDDLNRYLIDQQAWFPLWTPYTLVAYRSNLQGVMFDFQGGLIFHNVTVAP
jgi:peptide/nickel transport system substrate-binding protein